MQQPQPPRAPALIGPSFYLTGRQPLRPGAILLAVLASLGGICVIVYAMGHSSNRRGFSDRSGNASHGSDRNPRRQGRSKPD